MTDTTKPDDGQTALFEDDPVDSGQVQFSELEEDDDRDD